MVQASLKAAGFLALTLWAGSAAAISTGNELHAEFNGEHFKQLAAMLYVEGVVDGMVFGAQLAQVSQSKWLGCIPEGVTVGQIRDVVQKYLNDNPAERHLPASILVSKSLLRAFPCKP